MKLDLHTHTTFSDGDLEIYGNVRKALDFDLDGIAITDHDTIDSWQVIDGNEYPIMVIKGVELSTYYKNSSVHVLGYYLNDGGDYQELDEILKQIRQERLERLEKIISLLKPLGIELSKEEILKEAHGAVARPHVAKAIIKKYPELHLSIDDVFDQYIGNDAPAYVPVNNFQTEDAIALLKRNHCLVVIAHPLLIKKVDYKELFQFDIDGIEGFYNYSFDVEEDVVRVGDEYHILVTGGSDYHGPITRDSMGNAYVEDERAKVFLKKINLTSRM